MAEQVLRRKAAQARIGLGTTNFDENYVNHGRVGEEYLRGTTIKRLRPIRIGPRCLGFLESEVDELIAALARRRDTDPETMRPRTLAGRLTAARTSPPARPRRPTGTGTEAPVVKRRRVQSARGQ